MRCFSPVFLLQPCISNGCRNYVFSDPDTHLILDQHGIRPPADPKPAAGGRS